ncbi:DUF4326 domain-containing protein [Sphaerisporangium album]|uniref:DUF4326 domain-containing protein n=1 Tax=Sphaerisporangium album TaxID=509200 RepID=A0A367EN09_9ACTN|nr:DUF4326 domain-containing protein [Sphaerisporangium album]RCG19082.1 DUF4326 domain-containing protein [Sphaerisporangium album]
MARVRVIGDLWHGRVPDGAVYIGRAAPGLPRSVFANPHPVDKPCRPCGGLVHDRPGAVEAYRAGLTPELVARARVEIGDADVACWCAEEEPCHGDPLLEAIHAQTPPRAPQSPLTACGELSDISAPSPSPSAPTGTHSAERRP